MDLAKVSGWLSESKHIVALTGSGISAESGIPTFRGAGGLWKQFRAEDLATPEAFARDPRLVWEWYNERRMTIARKKPNPAHHTLARWEKRFADMAVITQNVDGLHQRAGSQKVVCFHGNIWEVRCTEENLVEANHETPLSEIPPRCRRCHAIVRPNIVWFGEIIPAEALHSSEEMLSVCDLLLVIGTSGVVYPAAGFACEVKARGCRVVDINLEDTPITDLADVSLRGKAGEILPEIDARLPVDI